MKDLLPKKNLFPKFTHLFKKPRRVLVGTLAVLAILGILGTVYFYHRYETIKKDPNAEKQAEVSSLVREVGQLMLLPGEAPTVATVLDTKVLKGQPFFQNAKNGDKVLVFVNARQAVLYRPAERKIINVAPLYFEDKETPKTETQPVAPPTHSASSTETKSASSTSSH